MELSTRVLHAGQLAQPGPQRRARHEVVDWRQLVRASGVGPVAPIGTIRS